MTESLDALGARYHDIWEKSADDAAPLAAAAMERIALGEEYSGGFLAWNNKFGPDADPERMLERGGWNNERKRAAASKLLLADASQSDRSIAARVGCSPQTVTAVRSELESTAQIEQLEKRTGADGKARKQPEKPAEPKPPAVPMPTPQPEPQTKSEPEPAEETPEPVAAQPDAEPQPDEAPALDLPPVTDEDMSAQAIQIIAKRFNLEMTVQAIAQDMGITIDAVRNVTDKEQIRRSVLPTIGPKILSKTARQQLETAIRQHKRAQDLEFEARVQEEVRKRLEATILPHYKATQERANIIIRNRKGFISKDQFNKIIKCLHPDSIQDEDRKAQFQEAFVLFRNLEIGLLSEEHFQAVGSPIPTNLSDLMKMRKAQ